MSLLRRLQFFCNTRRLGGAGRATVAGLLLVAGLAQPGAAPILAAPAPLGPHPCTPVVSSPLDNGAGSLREAVTCPPSNRTITFAGGLAGSTILLTSGEIPLTQTLTINGSGAPGVKVDAGNTSRVFNITASVPVTLTALVLQHGRAASGNGGAVLAGASSPLVLSHMQVLSSTASTGDGGGLYAGGTLTLTSTDFISNTSHGEGGGVFAQDPAVLTNGRFEGNQCTGSGCVGGGLDAFGKVTLIGTDFISNTSVGEGGGVFANDPVLLTNGRFQGNRCTGSGCAGGGLSADYFLTLTGTDFISNTSVTAGGGAYAIDAAVVTNGHFQRNQCTGIDCAGGGLYASGTLTLTGTDVISNSSLGRGGGAFAHDAAVLTNGRFQGNQCTTAASLASLWNVTVADNQAPSGGEEGCQGGGLFAAGTLTLTGTDFISNTSHGHGGGMIVFGVVLLTNGRFERNACIDADCLGGGLSADETALVLSSSFSGNQSAGSGGGVGIIATAQITLANVTLSGNTALIAGGGLYAGGASQASLWNVTVADNQAPSGGGTLAQAGVTLVVANTLFSNNSGGNCAGPIAAGTHNLEWPGAACATAGLSTGFSTADPLLAPLALNAPGTTLTRALLPASPARDHGDPASCAGPLVNNLDQRGVVRPLDSDHVPGAICDVGAYEAGAPVWLVLLPLVRK